MTKKRSIMLSLVICLSMLGYLPSQSFGAEEGSSSAVQTDAETAAKLGLLIGDGNGVDASYLGKSATRMQAAIISLRLQGSLKEATDFKGTANFTDANQVNASNQSVLAYLKAHPELGWNGSGAGSFKPADPISAQQFYKVLLEALGYKSGKDFRYADTEAFARSKGLYQITGTATLTNAHIATALVEALAGQTADGTTLFSKLQAAGVLDAAAAQPPGERIGLQTNEKLGTLFTDKSGMTLYFFTKDAADVNACQGECLKNWPIFYDEHLQIPSSLNKNDFTVLTRNDGQKQWMYKGWPLYYFAKDTTAGDVLGEAVGGVWFIAKSDYRVMLATSATAGNYLTDDYGRTLYYFDKDPKNASVCEGNCLVNWPAYDAVDGSVPSTLTAADFGMITRPDGSMQAAFKGYPLYYFLKDTAHGDLLGQGVNKVWYVIDPVQFTGTTAAAAVKTYTIDIKDFSFGTKPLTVEAGSKITFVNHDSMEHNAVAVDGSFATPLLKQDESYTITIGAAGTYDYYCEPHKKFMTGKIIVT
ncbi:plastocyanin/azurin family copper-binding protein [Paenibacillus aurantiacus]|uniref:Plastocyanin/azurin family copper-binding protein n=1 Tax=Paenibacillus aurantiacus TaxID=1936118 RepID=A0ABV5KV22_9BACL